VRVMPASRTAGWPRYDDSWSRAEIQDEFASFDAAHVWHPYAPLPAVTPAYFVESAAGARLRLRDGCELVDGMSSWWAAIHGYRHPFLDAAVTTQLGRMAHVMFGGLTHEPAVRLAAQLCAVAPAGLDRVFFCDSGSVSVEVALKVAAQYWLAKGKPSKNRVLAVRGGYHGDTFAAMSVCDPVDGMHHLFTRFIPAQLFAPRPPGGVDRPVDAAWTVELRALLEEHSSSLAAIIVEPVVQGAGGMWFYNPEYVRVLRDLCDEYGLLLVLDEIATGFGRTGAMFATEAARVSPDIMCVGKALSGGYLSLAAMLTTDEVASTISNGPAGALLHGPTFMANPLACAVASASLELLAMGSWQRDVRRVECGLVAGLAAAREVPGVRDVRVLGAIGVVQMDRPVDVTAATAAAVAAGVWLRPFRDLIYAMPPYVCTDEEIAAIADAIVVAARAVAA
jgi:adenosylmethionine---8-amino-7-oxononanoate aminotransferase